MTNEDQNSIYMMHDLDSEERRFAGFTRWVFTRSIPGLIYMFSGFVIVVNFFGSHFLD